MAKFFESREYTVFKFMSKVLGFVEDLHYSDSARQRQFDKTGFNLFVDNDGQFRLYKDGKNVASGTWPDDMNMFVDASKEDIYADQEEWLASRATAAATYRRLAEKRAEEARREEGGMGQLEISLMRDLHDLRKTAQIAKEGHQ